VLPLEKHVEIAFRPFQNSASSFPAQGALSVRLRTLIRKATSNTEAVTPALTSLFASAAVEIWHRAVHSFLISAALTRPSGLWGSVAGYYASHYTMRAFAHLLGYFQVYSAKRIVRVEISGAQHICTITRKKAGDGEHKVYWRIVKQSVEFSSDPFCMLNLEDVDISDLSHRSFANYTDHLDRFENFSVLSRAVLKSRIEHLSEIQLSSVPIPNRTNYADLDSIQLIAYHRIVRFRSLLDQILGGKNKFWNAHRSPNWCANLLDFQVVAPVFVSAYSQRP